MIKSLVLPPGCCLLLGLVGFLLYRFRPRLGLALVGTAFGLLFLLSTPACSRTMLGTLETSPPLTRDRLQGDVEAIVVLGAEAYSGAEEYGGDTIGPVTLERVRYAARLYRATGLPILTSGGIIRPSKIAVAQAMAATLEYEFGVPVRWIEPDSSNTFENARQSAAILERAGVHKIYLVTRASHMPRAKMSFEAMGLEVVPAPTAFSEPVRYRIWDFIPRASAMLESNEAFYEWLGRVWYDLAYL